MNARNYDVVVSGIGPAALSTAWELAKHTNKKILMVSNHEKSFLRMQSVFISLEMRRYLRDMSRSEEQSNVLESEKDQKFLKAINHDLTVGIKDVERYIMRRLEKLIQNGAKIDFEFNSELDEVNLNAGECLIRNKQQKADLEKKVMFNYLIDADGSQHHALNLVQMKLSTPEISFSSKDNKMYPYHIGAYVSIKTKDGNKLILPDRYALYWVHENSFVALRLHKESNAFSRVKNKIKSSILCELPEGIWHIENAEQRKKEGLEFIQKVIKKYFDGLGNGPLEVSLVANSKKHGEAKDRLKLLIFETKDLRASKASINSGDRCFFLIGDALNTTDYRFSSGINHALALAPKLRDAIVTQNVAEYEKVNQLLMKQYDENIRPDFFSEKKKESAKKIEEQIDELRKAFQKYGCDTCTII